MIIIVPDSMTLNNILVRQETGNQEPPQKKQTRHLIQETPLRCDWVIGFRETVTPPRKLSQTLMSSDHESKPRSV